MSYETITYSLNESVATILFNRPESLNAFNDQMIQDTLDALHNSKRDREVRCLVVTGKGRAFSAGQDLKEFQSRDASTSAGEHLRHSYNRIVKAMVTLEKPIIAAVNGVAAGAGCGVALAADIRIASDKASFIQAFSRVGLVPDSGTTWTLTRLIGYARAYEMAVTADRVDADTALEWGLVNRVVPDAQLEEISLALALKLAKGPTLAFGLTKRAMRKSSAISLEEALEYEALLQEHAARSYDSQEGVRAFIEKREPVYKGE